MPPPGREHNGHIPDSCRETTSGEGDAMSDIEKELIALEEQQWKANREADSEFYKQYCADDFLIVGNFGVLTKEQVLAQFERGNVNPFLRTEMEDPRVLVIGADSALLTYKETIEASIDAEDGRIRTFSVYATTVFRHTSDGWRFVLHHQTQL
jgi:ketosteroid isomerase-like protein